MLGGTPLDNGISAVSRKISDMAGSNTPLLFGQSDFRSTKGHRIGVNTELAGGSMEHEMAMK